MKQDLLERDYILEAIRDNRLGNLKGSTKNALRNRGLVKRVMKYRLRGYHRSPDGFTWILTEEGEKLRAQLIEKLIKEIQAARDAEGTIEVPRWAVREAVSTTRWRDGTSEWHKTLEVALGGSETP